MPRKARVARVEAADPGRQRVGRRLAFALRERPFGLLPRPLLGGLQVIEQPVERGVSQLRHVGSQVEVRQRAVRVDDVKADLPVRLFRQAFPRLSDLFGLLFRAHHR